MIFKEPRRMRRRAFQSHQPSDRAQRPREGAAVSRRQRGNRRNQAFLDGDRSSAQQTPPLCRHGEPLPTPVLARRDFRDEPLSHKPLNHNRYRALMRTGERRDVIDGRIAMLGDLLKREQLCAAKPRRVFAGATGPQRLDDVPESVERHTHIGRMSPTGGARDVLHDST
jgi:hypothetical protein